jgi:hypothetical protein
MEEEWIILRDVVRSGDYSKIAKTYKGFAPYIGEGRIASRVQYKGKMKITLLKRNDLDSLLALINELENNYFIDKEVAKMLGFEGKNPIPGSERRKEVLSNIKDFCNAEKIEYKYFKDGLKGSWLFVNKNQLNHFLRTHINQAVAYKQYNIALDDIRSLERRYKIKKVKISRMHNFYLLEDAEKYFNIHETSIDDFYTLPETLNTLGISRATMDSIRNEENLEPTFFKGKIYYSKETIKFLLKKMKEIRSQYCSSDDVMKICKLLYMPYEYLTSHPTTTLINLALGVKHKQSVFLLEEVYEYKNQIEKRNLIGQALENEPVNAFEQILTIKGISFSKNSIFTEKEWYSYCKGKLLLSNSNNSALRSMITGYVDCTAYLSKLTIDKELYSFHSNEINLNLFNNSIAIQKQQYLYSFLSEFHERVNSFVKEQGSNVKTFNISKIINPFKYESKEKPKEIYEYSEYDDVYEYAKNMTHKRQAILDAENIIRGAETKLHYASAWLYVLTHLGNAWRHSDITSLPTVNLKAIGLDSIETLKERDLTTEEATSIVNQIKRKDLAVQKTGAINKFNCPDDLILPFATAAVICTLIVINTRGIIIENTDDNKKAVNDTMINFEIKDNDFSKKAHNAFFKDFKIDGFQFQNRKMNRTILVLMYMILIRKGHGSAALKLAQRLRAHEDFESTNIYLLIPREELDELSESLFNRKHFGYIPDLMANILLGDSEDRNKRTQEIIAIQELFGGLQKIEATSGFINKTLSERQLVADKIFSMGLDKVADLMFDLEVNSLPSREENFQCIVASDGCQKPELESCKDCPFSVPNFYTISSLVEGVKTTILEFINEYEPSCFEGEKTHLMNGLYKDMDNLERAMQKFGQSEVFNFFENGEEEYNELLNLLDQLQTQNGEEFEKYLTYNPIFLS